MAEPIDDTGGEFIDDSGGEWLDGVSDSTTYDVEQTENLEASDTQTPPLTMEVSQTENIEVTDTPTAVRTVPVIDFSGTFLASDTQTTAASEYNVEQTEDIEVVEEQQALLGLDVQQDEYIEVTDTDTPNVTYEVVNFAGTFLVNDITYRDFVPIVVIKFDTFLVTETQTPIRTVNVTQTENAVFGDYALPYLTTEVSQTEDVELTDTHIYADRISWEDFTIGVEMSIVWSRAPGNRTVLYMRKPIDSYYLVMKTGT